MCVTGADPSSSILVRPGFLGAQDRAALLARADALPPDAGLATHVLQGGLRRKLLGSPGWLASSLWAKLGSPADERLIASTTTEAGAGKEELLLLPMYAMMGDYPEQHDHYISGPRQGILAEGRVGVLYLEATVSWC